MTWLEESDVREADRFARSLLGSCTVAELRRRALAGLAELVPADVLTWDRVELGTGVVRHEVIPVDAEPPGAFAAIVGDASGHPQRQGGTSDCRSEGSLDLQSSNVGQSRQ